MTGKEALEYLKKLSDDELCDIIHVSWWELDDVRVKRDAMLRDACYDATQKKRLKELDEELMMGILHESVYDNTEHSDATTEAINGQISDSLESVANGTYFEDEEEK